VVGPLRARRREAREETPVTGENGAGTKASSDRACAAARMTAVPERRRGWAVAPAPEPRFLAHAVAAEQRARIPTRWRWSSAPASTRQWRRRSRVPASIWAIPAPPHPPEGVEGRVATLGGRPCREGSIRAAEA